MKDALKTEPWYLLTNIENLDEVIKIYRSRMSIEAMFKDCKTGGYNLEGSQACSTTSNQFNSTGSYCLHRFILPW